MGKRMKEKKIKGDYIKLKESFGEKFAKFCRENFPTLILEGKLYDIITKHFSPSKFLYQDIIDNDKENLFVEFIYSKVDKDYRPPVVKEDIETPEELMKRAGYILTKCDSVEDIEKFKKYYAEDEVLCTFKNPKDRLKHHVVFFAVKENVDNLKREKFLTPRKHDDYGISVISIQFPKRAKSQMVSIKNRYNHRVLGCDATFSNDLEQIYPGLTESFIRHYNIDFSKSFSKFELPGYVCAKDKRYYKYNYHINNIYYCADNIVINDLEPIIYSKGQYEVFDYFVIDKKYKMSYFTPRIEPFREQFDGLNVEVRKVGDKGDKLIRFISEDVEPIEVIVNKFGQMISFKNPNIRKLDNYYLHDNIFLEKLDLENVEVIGDSVLVDNQKLTELNIPKVKKIGRNFLRSHNAPISINAPNLQSIGESSIGALIQFLDGKDLID